MRSINPVVLCCLLWNFGLLAMDLEEDQLPTAPPQQGDTYDGYFAKVAIPRLFKSMQKLLASLIEIDAPSEKDASYRINLLNSAAGALISHFQDLVLNPRPTNPPTKTQNLRIMIAVLNAGLYRLLPDLLERFDNNASIKIGPKSLETEKDLFNFIKRVFFHCSLIVGDVNIVLKPSTKDKKVMEEAIASYLLQEAKELSLATKEQFEEYKRILKIQTEYNKEKLWSSLFSIPHSIEYMILRRPNTDHEALFNEVLERIVKANPKQPKHTIIIDGIDQEKYQIVNCTLKHPGTWNLKKYELMPVFATLKVVMSKLAMILKPKIVGLIKSGFEREQFIAKGNNSLDNCLDLFAEATIHPAVNILMKKNGLDKFSDQVLPEIQALFYKLYELADQAEKQSVSTEKIDLESILKKLDDGVDSIIVQHLSS